MGFWLIVLAIVFLSYGEPSNWEKLNNLADKHYQEQMQDGKNIRESELQTDSVNQGTSPETDQSTSDGRGDE